MANRRKGVWYDTSDDDDDDSSSSSEEDEQPLIIRRRKPIKKKFVLSIAMIIAVAAKRNLGLHTSKCQNNGVPKPKPKAQKDENPIEKGVERE